MLTLAEQNWLTVCVRQLHKERAGLYRCLTGRTAAERHLERETWSRNGGQFGADELVCGSQGVMGTVGEGKGVGARGGRKRTLEREELESVGWFI